MFRTFPLPIIRSFFHFSDSNNICHRACEQFRPDHARKLCDIYHFCVYSEKKAPDDGQRNFSQHVEFYSKNKFEKLVRLFGFIIRIYREARSLERQIQLYN